MITTFIIGKPGDNPRMIFTASEAVAQLQCQDGEVCFNQVNYPPAPHVINNAGDKLVAAEVSLTALWRDARVMRNALLNDNRWTVMPDSPLSAESQSAWLGYLGKLHRLTVDNTDPRHIAWPVQPELVFPTK